MSDLSQRDVRNRILAHMPVQCFDLLAPHLETVDLLKGDILTPADGVVTRVVFPETGIVSVVVQSPDGAKVEGGLFGRDGFGPVSVIMGSDETSSQHVVQVAGTARQIDTSALRQATGTSPNLQIRLLRFAHVLATQISYTALTNVAYGVDVRLARWILMVDDRCEGDDIALTHEFLSIMLGVRRATVTDALHVLEGDGLIRSSRGHLRVRDRTALAAFAGSAYGKPEAEYRKLIGAM